MMIVYLLAIGVMMIGIYAVTMKDNLIKKLLGLSIMTNGIHVFLIALGYRDGGVIPILQEIDLQRFAMNAVDPLPQALVLTSIVINLSILAVGLSITILLYRKHGTLDSSRIRRLSG
jgi:multisubunit Na+/H+ antiporter MnhC subunit